MSEKKPQSRAMDILQDSVTRFWTRQEIMNLLRERHQLSMWECIGEKPEVVRARQDAYDADMAKFREKWEREDQEHASKAKKEP